MRYRLWTLRFFVHESLKRDNKEENYERKKCKVMRNNETIFFEMLLCIPSYHFLKIVVNNIYRL